MTTYNVTVTREDDLWVAEVHGLPPHLLGITDVEHFADLAVEVRDLIAGLTDTDPDSFSLTWHYVVGDVDVTSQIEHLLGAEDELRAASAEREQARTETLDALRRASVSQAVIGDVLGLSHQRVHQLIKADA